MHRKEEYTSIDSRDIQRASYNTDPAQLGRIEENISIPSSSDGP